MELFGKQQHLYFINHDLADQVLALVRECLNGGRTAEAPLQLASRAAALAEDLISNFEAANRLPHPIACRAGCSFCCFNQVEVTPPEALLIGHYVGRNFSGAERDALMAGVSRALDLKAGKSKRKMARLRQQFPCPLLQRGKCSVYEVRPWSAGPCTRWRRSLASRNYLRAGSGRVNFTPTAMRLSGPSAPDCKPVVGKAAAKRGSWTWMARCAIFLLRPARWSSGLGEKRFFAGRPTRSHCLASKSLPSAGSNDSKVQEGVSHP
ncbi:MAG: hypothetical protein WC443_11410 [Desulfobaccales bacterium]